MLPSATKANLEASVYHVIGNISMNIVSDSEQRSRLVTSCQIAALMEEATLNSTNRILLAVRNLMKTLLQHVIEDGPQETELITRHLQAALVLLASISDDEKTITLRPDALINIVHGTALDRR
ncbi:hypothetical protein G6F37_003367 [Rhizopus arrhizus]|nr:hypothetical protein G6F38_002408 [Rhizopus arrhizus]KAG1161122.1 hypothetical protein G6F37_003367 [Rhizopus arrhizus]